VDVAPEALRLDVALKFDVTLTVDVALQLDMALRIDLALGIDMAFARSVFVRQVLDRRSPPVPAGAAPSAERQVDEEPQDGGNHDPQPTGHGTILSASPSAGVRHHASAAGSPSAGPAPARAAE
jgi:hypothetical protein